MSEPEGSEIGPVDKRIDKDRALNNFPPSKIAKNTDGISEEFLSSLDESELEDFFQKKGAIEILVGLKESGLRFGDFEDNLNLSPNTISKRLKEGRRLKLWSEEIVYPDDETKFKLYTLDPFGRFLAKYVDELNLGSVVEQRRKIEARYRSISNDFLDICRDISKSE